MHFTKMHGLGNDFIMIDCMGGTTDVTDIENAAVAICDRRFGIGADGLIFVEPSDKADFRMRVINSDGSQAEMCGNGIRCLAKYVYDRGAEKASEITVDTDAGIKTVQLFGSNGKAEKVRVDMGEPEFRRSAIPMAGPDESMVKGQLLQVAGQELAITCLSMGNPHCVSFVNEVESFPLSFVGPEVERHPTFPKRANVEFVEVLGPGEIRMRVWERGAGETLACGTGACAAAIASVVNGMTERQVLVHLAGGNLKIEWADDNRVFMTGPAAEVFSGEFEPSIFSTQ